MSLCPRQPRSPLPPAFMRGVSAKLTGGVRLPKATSFCEANIVGRSPHHLRSKHHLPKVYIICAANIIYKKKPPTAKTCILTVGGFRTPQSAIKPSRQAKQTRSVLRYMRVCFCAVSQNALHCKLFSHPPLTRSSFLRGEGFGETEILRYSILYFDGWRLL